MLRSIPISELEKRTKNHWVLSNSLNVYGYMFSSEGLIEKLNTRE